MDAISKEAQREEASRIAKAWGLSGEERDRLLDDRESVIAVISIFESLRVIYSEDPDRAFIWPTKPNKEFGGKPALEVMLDGDIEQVRRYLKYHCYNA